MSLSPLERIQELVYILPDSAPQEVRDRVAQLHREMQEAIGREGGWTHRHLFYGNSFSYQLEAKMTKGVDRGDQ